MKRLSRLQCNNRCDWSGVNYHRVTGRRHRPVGPTRPAAAAVIGTVAVEAAAAGPPEAAAGSAEAAAGPAEAAAGVAEAAAGVAGMTGASLGKPIDYLLSFASENFQEPFHPSTHPHPSPHLPPRPALSSRPPIYRLIGNEINAERNAMGIGTDLKR